MEERAATSQNGRYMSHELPDYTDFDFSEASLYKSKPHEPVDAYQLDEDYIIVRSWGKQYMEPGDWVVLKPGSDGEVKESGVGSFAFDATYVCVGAGQYIRQKYILAQQIDHDYQFTSPDSPGEPAQAPGGSYIALNMSKDQVPLEKEGVRDILYYKQRDIDNDYDLVQE